MFTLKPRENYLCFALHFICLILVAAAMLSGVVQVNAATTANLIRNGNAEKGTLQYWKASNDKWKATEGEGYGSTCVPHKGKYFFWAVNDSSNKTYLYQNVKVKSGYIGKTVILTCYTSSWPQTPTDHSRLQITFYDKNKKKVGSVYKTHKKAKWEKVKVTAKIPAGASKMRVYLIGLRKNGVVDAYFDDVVLKVKTS